MTRDGIEDYYRWKADEELNNMPIQVRVLVVKFTLLSQPESRGQRESLPQPSTPPLPLALNLTFAPNPPPPPLPPPRRS